MYLPMFEEVKPISITPKAIQEIKAIMNTKRIPEGYGLRIGVKGGGCGTSLVIGFDTKTPEDKEYNFDNVPVYIDKRHAFYVFGKEVDFYEGADARGFIFNNETS